MKQKIFYIILFLIFILQGCYKNIPPSPSNNTDKNTEEQPAVAKEDIPSIKDENLSHISEVESKKGETETKGNEPIIKDITPKSHISGADAATTSKETTESKEPPKQEISSNITITNKNNTNPHISGAETEVEVKPVPKPEIKKAVETQKQPEIETPLIQQQSEPSDLYPKEATAPQELSKQEISSKDKDTKSITTIKHKNNLIGGEQIVPPPIENTDAKGVLLNFEEADIKDIIISISDLLNLNYIIDPGISGSITIHSSEKIPVNQLFSILLQILEINGYTITKDGDFFRFISVPDAVTQPIPIYIGRDTSLLPKDDRLILIIIPLNYIPVSKLQEILTPLTSKNGRFLEIEGPNNLYLFDSAYNVKRVIELINILDVDAFEKIQIKLIELHNTTGTYIISLLSQIYTTLGYMEKGKQHLQFIDIPGLNSILLISSFPELFKSIESWISKFDSKQRRDIELKLIPITYLSNDEISQVIEELNTIFSAIGYKNTSNASKGGDGTILLDFIPIARLKSILVINSYKAISKEIEEWINKLDQPTVDDKTTKKIYVYYVQNTEAANIANILNQLYEEKRTILQQPIEPNKKQGKKEKKEGEKKEKKEITIESASHDTIAISADILGELMILPDKTTNALVIRTNPRNYPIIIETIKKLDLMPKQVLIEVLVAELQLDDQIRYGLEWALKNTSPTKMGVASSATGITINPSGVSLGRTGIQGLSFFVHQTEELLTLLQGFASSSKLDVLSSPILLTSENRPASISITNQIPIASTVVDPATNTTQTSFQFKDVGIKMNVLPKINREKFVNLDISQEVSQVSDMPTGVSAPAFFTRQAQTNVVVPDNQTLVIGGLIEKRKTNTSSGIPYLIKLPFMGCLFGSLSNRHTKSELLIFITPHVITNKDEFDSISDIYNKNVEKFNKNLKEGMELVK